MTKNVPIILQLNKQECGPACLAMLLNYFGRNTRLAEVRTVCVGGRDGVTARTLLKAARSYGLDARAFSIDPDALAQVQLPAVLHWNASHFVVLERFTPDRVTIIDPGSGRRRLSREEFLSSFSHVVLNFAPNSRFEGRADPPPSLVAGFVRRIWRMPGVSLWASQILATSVVLQCLGFSVAGFTKLLVDRILPGHGNGLEAVS